MKTLPPAPADAGYCAAPAWLDHSGLPEALNAVRKNAWAVFKKLVELDCARHPTVPGLVEVEPAEIARWTGFDTKAVWRTCQGLARKRLIRAYIPPHEAEPIFYEIAAPLPVPRPIDEIRADVERHCGAAAARAGWRYWMQAPGQARDEDLHRAVVDLYLNHISSTLNATVVDELAILADRYPLDVLREVFRRADTQDERHLAWVFTHLHHRQAPRRATPDGDS